MKASRLRQPLVGANTLKEELQQMSLGEEFDALLEESVEKNDRFAVLVVCMDDFEKMMKDLGEEITSGAIARLARTLEAVSNTHSIKYGQLDQKRFACFCPDLEEETATELAREIQRRLALAGAQTVSVGIAVYPFWTFEKTSILDNAQKALDHAAFFGANTITPFDAVSLNISADKLYQSGDIDGAIAEFKKALIVDPENVNVHNSIGVCYGVQGKLDLATDAFEAATGLDCQDVMATYNLGLAHLKQGNRHKALDLFLDAHALDGDHPDISGQIGICYQEMGETDTALEYLKKAAENNSRGAQVFRALGECYLDKHMLREAAKSYERAVKGYPADAKSLSALGHVYGLLGENLQIAIVLAHESTTIDPDNGLYRHRLGKLYLQNKEYDKAVEQFKKATELGEDCAELLGEAQGG